MKGKRQDVCHSQYGMQERCNGHNWQWGGCCRTECNLWQGDWRTKKGKEVSQMQEVFLLRVYMFFSIPESAIRSSLIDNK